MHIQARIRYRERTYMYLLQQCPHNPYAGIVLVLNSLLNSKLRLVPSQNKVNGSDPHKLLHILTKVLMIDLDPQTSLICLKNP